MWPSSSGLPRAAVTRGRGAGADPPRLLCHRRVSRRAQARGPQRSPRLGDWAPASVPSTRAHWEGHTRQADQQNQRAKAPEGAGQAALGAHTGSGAPGRVLGRGHSHMLAPETFRESQRSDTSQSASREKPRTRVCGDQTRVRHGGASQATRSHPGTGEAAAVQATVTKHTVCAQEGGGKQNHAQRNGRRQKRNL